MYNKEELSTIFFALTDRLEKMQDVEDEAKDNDYINYLEKLITKTEEMLSIIDKYN